MYKLCRTEQSSQRQRQLEQGLLQLMQVVRYEEISISDLCERMQIPRKSFYRYFSSKDGALFALLDHTMLDFYEDGFRTPNAGTALGELDQFFAFWYEKKELLDALQKSGLSGILVERATELARRERMMPDRMKLWTAHHQELALSFAICGLMSMILQWHHQGYPISPGEMTRLATAMLTRPLVEI
jgi:AcrR family transcriptional regulator